MHEGLDPWWIELVGHHASMPLALAILYVDYRFAFADIFLKRALAMTASLASLLVAYVVILDPLLQSSSAPGSMDARVIALLAAGALTALIYPSLHQASSRLVDRWILRRADHDQVRRRLAHALAKAQEPRSVLEVACRELAPVLSAERITWMELLDVESKPVITLGRRVIGRYDGDRSLTPLWQGAFPDSGSVEAVVFVPTADPPSYALVIGPLSGGRRLLSDDINLLEGSALMIGSRVDAVRVSHERCERDLREQEIRALAREAELRSLRAQLNPHFLFNALTSIGYLIAAAPDKALDTLVRLTELLRRVLRAPVDEFVALEEEIGLAEAYLEIEKARFEDRLEVRVEVPESARLLAVPPLLLQPLVENAIKHGIAPSRRGGTVRIEADLQGTPQNGYELCLRVSDTGVGTDEETLLDRQPIGLGLASVERRLHSHYGERAHLRFQSERGAGTTVELRIPVAVRGRAEAAARARAGVFQE
jgi:signal transduction histidine kinase